MRVVYLALIVGLFFAAVTTDAQQSNASVQPGPMVRSGFPASADVFVNGVFALRIPARAARMSPMQRAQAVADRLNQAFAEGLSWESLRVSQFQDEWGVAIDSRLVVTADTNSARAYRTSPGQLASRWARQTVIAMGGEPQMIASQLQPIPGMVAGAQAEITLSWTTSQTKTVPLLDTETGNEMGSVMVAGTREQLNRVNSVILFQTTSDIAHVWTFAPITGASTTSPTRVQGVGVVSIPSALIPLTGWQMGANLMPMITQSGTDWNANISSMLTEKNVQLRGNTKVVPVYSMDTKEIIGAAQVVGSMNGIRQTQAITVSPSGNMWKLSAIASQPPITGTPTGLTDVVVSALIMVPMSGEQMPAMTTPETPEPEMTTPPSPTEAEEEGEMMPPPPP